MIRCYFKSNANQAKVIHVEKLKPLEGALRNVPPAPDRCLNLQPGPETLAKKKKRKPTAFSASYPGVCEYYRVVVVLTHAGCVAVKSL